MGCSKMTSKPVGAFSYDDRDFRRPTRRPTTKVHGQVSFNLDGKVAFFFPRPFQTILSNTFFGDCSRGNYRLRIAHTMMCLSLCLSLSATYACPTLLLFSNKAFGNESENVWPVRSVHGIIMRESRRAIIFSRYRTTIVPI